MIKYQAKSRNHDHVDREKLTHDNESHVKKRGYIKKKDCSRATSVIINNEIPI